MEIIFHIVVFLITLMVGPFLSLGQDKEEFFPYSAVFYYRCISS